MGNIIKLYGSKCGCVGNCTHDFFNSIFEDGVVVAWVQISGGLNSDRYSPSKAEFIRYNDMAAQVMSVPGWRPVSPINLMTEEF